MRRNYIPFSFFKSMPNIFVPMDKVLVDDFNNPNHRDARNNDLDEGLSAIIPNEQKRISFINALKVDPNKSFLVLPPDIPGRYLRIIKHLLLDILRYPHIEGLSLSDQARALYEYYPINTYGSMTTEVIQGGVSMDNMQRKNLYDFYTSMELSGIPRVLVTGSGPGTMNIPFAVRHHLEQYSRDIDTCIGITELGIMAKEVPNQYNDILRVSKDIYQRMMKFIAPADVIRFHEGGAGTMQELITFLETRFSPENKDFNITSHAVGMRGKDFMKMVEEFLYEFLSIDEETLSSKISFFQDVNPKNPNEYIDQYQSDMNQKKLQHGIFRPDLYFPDSVLSPPNTEVEYLSALQFLKTDSFKDRLTKFNAVLNALVEYPIRKKQYPPITIHGDTELIEPMKKLVEKMYTEKRIPGPRFINFVSYKDQYLFIASS